MKAFALPGLPVPKVIFAFLLIICPLLFLPTDLLSFTDTQVNPAIAASLPVDGEVCFSPAEPCDQKLLKFINSAQKSLDIAVFDLTLQSLADLVVLKNKQVKVRALVDYRQSRGTHSLVDHLISEGVEVRYGKQKGIMHNKFVIVDGRMIESGSFNYTNNATNNNNENQIYLATPTTVKRFKQRFEDIWGVGRQVEN